MTGFDRIVVLLLAAFGAWPARGADLAGEKRIPDEYESTSGLGGAFNNAGYALNDPHGAVRANPALLPLQRTYSIAGGYHWPVAGREYFQASVVDSKTSPIAAGVSYTGFTDDYRYEDEVNAAARDDARADSPVSRRGGGIL